MRAIHIFHHTDNDGHTSAAVMYHYIKECRKDISKIIFHEVDYTMDLDMYKIPEGDMVAFLDYSFSNDDNIRYLVELLKNAYEVIWIDHHVTSYNLINNDNKYHLASYKCLAYSIDTTRCAAWLTYQWCYYSKYNDKCVAPLTEDRMPLYIKYVDDHDRWVHKMKNTEEFAEGYTGWKHTPRDMFRSMVYNTSHKWSLFDPEDDHVKDLMAKFVYDLIENGRLIKSYNDCRYEREREFCGFTFTINDKVNKKTYNGYAMNIHANSPAFGDMYNEYDLVVLFVFNGEQWRYSMYSSKDYVNCEDLCKRIGVFDGLGGGGHKGAAGFQTYESILYDGCIVELTQTALRKKPIVHITCDI